MNKETLLLIPLCLCLMGQIERSCPPPPPPAPNAGAYCSGAVLPAFFEEYPTIVGGTPSVNRRSTVYLYSTASQRGCSGVIIGPHAVLTAKHCVASSQQKVYLDHRLNNPAVYYDVVDSVEEPMAYDLAILYVNEVLPTPYVTNYYDNTLSDVCETMIAQGWGQTEDIEDPDYVPCPDRDNNGIPDAHCLRESLYTVILENHKQLTTMQLTEGSVCFGDSGGPLYVYLEGQQDPWLAGVVSLAGIDCLSSATHIKVSAFKDWILDNTDLPP
jgi:secreted trypsin-like serine protease